MENCELKLQYQAFKGQQFQSLAGKLMYSPTTTQKAAQLRKFAKAVTAANETISKSFDEDILQKYAEKNEDGTIKRPEDNPDGWNFPEATKEESTKALADFGKREVVLTLERPLTPDLLSDIKMSAVEIEQLGGLFSDENGPGVPQMPLQLKK